MNFNCLISAVLMKVTSIVPKFKQQLFTATAVIVRSIHQGMTLCYQLFYLYETEIVLKT